jgi:hypothetical protein
VKGEGEGEGCSSSDGLTFTTDDDECAKDIVRRTDDDDNWVSDMKRAGSKPRKARGNEPASKNAAGRARSTGTVPDRPAPAGERALVTVGPKHSVTQPKDKGRGQGDGDGAGGGKTAR